MLGYRLRWKNWSGRTATERRELPAKSHTHYLRSRRGWKTGGNGREMSGGGGGEATVQISKQGLFFWFFWSKANWSWIFGNLLRLTFRLFVPPPKNSAEKEDLPSVRFPVTSIVPGIAKPGATGGRCLGGETVKLLKQEIPSFSQKLSGHEFLESYYPSAIRLFLPPLKNSAEKEDLPSRLFPIPSVVLRFYVGQHICIWC